MSMPEDRQMLRHVWEGRVAVSITVADEDLKIMSTGTALPTSYVILPRMSYFTVALEQVGCL